MLNGISEACLLPGLGSLTGAECRGSCSEEMDLVLFSDFRHIWVRIKFIVVSSSHCRADLKPRGNNTKFVPPLGISRIQLMCLFIVRADRAFLDSSRSSILFCRHASSGSRIKVMVLKPRGKGQARGVNCNIETCKCNKQLCTRGTFSAWSIHNSRVRGP